MSNFFGMKQWIIAGVTICLLLINFGSPKVEANNNMPVLAKELLSFPQIPFNQFKDFSCTSALKSQFGCELNSLIPAEKLLVLGNFANFGSTKVSLQTIADKANIDLSKIGADKLQSFYSLITPNKLLDGKFNNLYPQKLLADLPLVKEAFIQDLVNKFKLGDFSQLQPLNGLLKQFGGLSSFINGDSLDVSKLSQQLSNVALGKLVSAIPSVGNLSLGNLPISILKSFNVNQAISGLITQSLGNIANIESLGISELGAIGFSNLSISQLTSMANLPSVSLVGGVSFGQFDLPLSADEQDKGRQISGGIPNSDYQLRKKNCGGNCKMVEIAPIDPRYKGATWIDGEDSKNWVPDGFGIVCAVWPGGCRGPAGNNPFGSGVRVLLTKIDAKSGTAQVSITFPLCYDVWFVGTTCTPSVFPIPSGIPLYTVKEKDWLPFVIPQNYGSSASLPKSDRLAFRESSKSSLKSVA